MYGIMHSCKNERDQLINSRQRVDTKIESGHTNQWPYSSAAHLACPNAVSSPKYRGSANVHQGPAQPPPPRKPGRTGEETHPRPVRCSVSSLDASVSSSLKSKYICEFHLEQFFHCSPHCLYTIWHKARARRVELSSWLVKKSSSSCS